MTFQNPTDVFQPTAMSIIALSTILADPVNFKALAMEVRDTFVDKAQSNAEVIATLAFLLNWVLEAAEKEVSVV